MGTIELPPVGGGGGIQSVNGSTVSAQITRGSGSITVDSALGTTTIGGGGGGSPGGTDGQLQYNASGVFGGDTATTDGVGNLSASSFIGDGSSLTGNAAGLSIGGSASNAAFASSADFASFATNLDGSLGVNFAEEAMSFGAATLGAEAPGSPNLAVAGNLDVAGVVYAWPGANAAGALTNDGSGNLSWTPPASVGPGATLAGFNESTGVLENIPGWGFDPGTGYGLQSNLDNGTAVLTGFNFLTNGMNSAAGGSVGDYSFIRDGATIDALSAGSSGVELRRNINTEAGNHYGFSVNDTIGTIQTGNYADATFNPEVDSLAFNYTGLAISPRVTEAALSAESVTINMQDDVAGSSAGKGFSFSSPYDQGANAWTPWFKVSGAGSPPTCCGNFIEVDVSTGDTAATLATAVYNAIITNSGITDQFTIANPGGGVALLAKNAGAAPFPAFQGPSGPQVNIFSFIGGPYGSGDGSAIGLNIDMSQAAGFETGNVHGIQDNGDFRSSVVFPLVSEPNAAPISEFNTRFTAPASASIAGADNFGVASLSEVDVGAGATITSGSFGVGTAASGGLGLLNIGVGATVEDVDGLFFAIVPQPGVNDGGVLTNAHAVEAVILPGAALGSATTITNAYAFHARAPAGNPATANSWGIYAEAGYTQNFLGSQLKVGGSDTVSTGGVGLEVAADIMADSNIDLPATTSAAVGVISQNGAPLLQTSNTNLFIGGGTGNFTNSGGLNTAVGSGSQPFVAAGQFNTSVGANALATNSAGSSNTAVGLDAMYADETGSNNTGIGQQALFNTIDGFNNTAVGYESLFTNVDGSGSTALGWGALYQATNSSNAAFGVNAGGSVVSGSNDTFLGTSADGTATVSFSTAVGYNATVAQDHSIVLGDFTDGSLQVGIGTNAPSEKLEVDGGIKMTAGSGGTITFPDGTIQSTASGGGATQTTVSGSVSGGAVFSQPFLSTAYKKIAIYCNNLTGAASYTFPTSFTFTPAIMSTNGPAAAIVTSISSTLVTVTGAATSGFIFLEGY